MNKSVLCIGATLWDELYFPDQTLVPGTSNPAKKTTAIGGVVSNIVQHLALLNIKASLLTALGNDAESKIIQEHFNKVGIDTSASTLVPENTGKYVSILNTDGNLYVAVSQDPCTTHLTVKYLTSKAEYIKSFDMIIMDTNLDTASIQWLIHFAQQNKEILIIEPVSVPKAAKLSKLDLNGVFMITPNEEELQVLTPLKKNTEDNPISALFARGVASVWLSTGANGSELHRSKKSLALGVPSVTLIDTTGAGDAALAGWVYGYLNKRPSRTCLQLGHALALHILRHKGAVDASLTPATLESLLETYYHA